MLSIRYLTICLSFLITIPLQSQNEELYAWCIVPFDKMERSPSERMQMLKDLGITTYAYDWRDKHLTEMEEEFNLARKNNIKINAVWMWIDPKVDALNKLSPANEKVLSTIKKTGLETTLWVSFHPDYFKDLTEEERVSRGAEMVYNLYQRCKDMDCGIALYNHGDWFGDPANQIKIIKLLGRYDIGLVYSFHHGHQQIEDFIKMARMMEPFLVAVNLNGMKRGGPQIYPLGQGDDEKQMLQVLLDIGYKGPFGILGHKEDADVKLILQENLKGYRKLIERG